MIRFVSIKKHILAFPQPQAFVQNVLQFSVRSPQSLWNACLSCGNGTRPAVIYCRLLVTPQAKKCIQCQDAFRMWTVDLSCSPHFDHV